MENQQNSPKFKYYQAQLNLINTLENKHDQEPDLTALILAGGLSLVEATVAFILLSSAGFLTATIGALFPVLLLWIMANSQADNVEIPQQFDQLVEKYNESVK